MRNTLVKKSLLGGRLRARYLRDTEAGAGGGGTGGDDGTTDTSDDTGDDEGGDDDAGDTSTDDTKTVSQAEFERVKTHLSNADRKKAEALARVANLEQELNSLKNKDLPEAERAKAEHEATVKERDSFKGRFEKMARTNAFLLASADAKIAWVNSSDALRLGDLDDLEIEEDGTVPGMAEAVKKLAKDRSYLVAPKDSTDTKDTPPKSGSVVGSKGKGKAKEEGPSDEELRRLYPALYR